jgi:hypothetical protein
LAILSFSCSVQKRSLRSNYESSGTTGNRNTLNEVLKNNLSNNDFYIQRADVRLTQENVTVRFNAAIKFKRPDSLLVSVKAKTGMEAGRALITRDTLIINDRINKRVIVGDAKSIRKKYGIDPYYIFALLGDLIVNERETARDIDCSRGLNMPRIQTNDKRIEYTIDCSMGKVVKALFEGDVRSGNILLNYSGFTALSRIMIPGKIEISDDLNNMNILIEIRKIEMPWNGQLKLITGSGYKIFRIR